MPKEFEVEVSFFLTAIDEDDAIEQVRQELEKQEVAWNLNEVFTEGVDF